MTTTTVDNMSPRHSARALKIETHTEDMWVAELVDRDGEMLVEAGPEQSYREARDALALFMWGAWRIAKTNPDLRARLYGHDGFRFTVTTVSIKTASVAHRFEKVS